MSDEIDCGVIIPETPLCLSKVALKYMYIGYGGTIYNASVVTNLKTPISMDLVKGYKLIVPGDIFAPDDGKLGKSTIDYVSYPKYFTGDQDLQHDFIKYYSWKTNKLGLFDYNYAQTTFEIDEKGIVNNISFQDEFDKVNETNKLKVIEFLKQARFEPGKVRGKFVTSEAHCRFGIPK